MGERTPSNCTGARQDTELSQPTALPALHRACNAVNPGIPNKPSQWPALCLRQHLPVCLQAIKCSRVWAPSV